MTVWRADQIGDYVRAHAAWGGVRPGETPGFTLPVTAGGRFQVFSGSQPSMTTWQGVRLARPLDLGRVAVWLGPDCGHLEVTIAAEPDATGLVMLDGPGSLHCVVSMHAQDHVFIAAPSPFGRTFQVNLWGNGTAVFFGQGGSCNSATLLAEGDHLSVQVGDDAMLADGVEISSTDSHGIFEIANPACMINPPAGVVVHPHVWIGRHVSVGKGRVIGAGSIIGQRSVVTQDLPACVVAAGVPARVIREGVSWTRPWPFHEPSVRAALAVLGL